MSHLEIETKLAICADRPDEIADRVAALPVIAGYHLEPSPDLHIRDRYLDRGGELASLGIGMRIRRVGDRRLVTLKGPATSTAGTDVTRSELEHEWSRRALVELRAGLATYGVALDVTAGLEDLTPEEALESLGFELDQDRETWRRPRHLIDPGSVAALAELAVDRVVFRIEGMSISHCEVEIEAKDPAGLTAMRRVARALASEFGDELRVWRLSKRGLGKVLEGLQAAGLLPRMLGAGGGLIPEAYGAIERWTEAQRR